MSKNSDLSNSAKRMITAAQKIKDPDLRAKKIADARRLSYKRSANK